MVQGLFGRCFFYTHFSERKQKLTAAGYDYSAVQKRVNELLR
nr:hypothetical protein [uncultured Blautia sp.]